MLVSHSMLIIENENECKCFKIKLGNENKGLWRTRGPTQGHIWNCWETRGLDEEMSECAKMSKYRDVC